MTTPKPPPRPDGFDQLLAEYQNSTHDYEDHDADLRHVFRSWSRLSAEGKLGYIARDAALYNVPFERFEQAAREMAGGQALPAGEHSYLRLHMEYQRALWDAELPAFPREHPLPADEPHRDFLDSLDGVLHVKFERLFDDYLNGKQSFADTNGQMRSWTELSPESKIEHIARLAAIFDIPLSRFTEAVHDTLDGQPLHTDEMACLRLHYGYARQLRDRGPHPLPLAQKVITSTDDTNSGITSEERQNSLLNEALSILSEMTAQFEIKHLARHSYAEATIATGLLEVARAVIARGTAFQNRNSPDSLRDALFNEIAPRPEPQPEPNHERHHKR